MLGVDILGTAVEEAERNAAVNRLGHCSYITGNVEDAVPRMVQAAKHEEVGNISMILRFCCCCLYLLKIIGLFLQGGCDSGPTARRPFREGNPTAQELQSSETHICIQ